MLDDTTGGFHRYGQTRPKQPVILSVPHAGRDYPPALERLSRHNIGRLGILEDRLADLLVAKAIHGGTSAIIAKSPRVWIDLNRDETDLDPALFEEPVRHNPILSAKARGGLGLIPSHTGRLGQIWSRKLSRDDLEQRIALYHRPFHNWIATTLDSVRASFGESLLLDIHSMPSLPAQFGDAKTDIVIGDLFSRSCHPRLSEIAIGYFQGQGLNTSLNIPYAGNYILMRHGKPQFGQHAMQIEIDRALYLNTRGTEPSLGLQHMQRLIAGLVELLASEVGRPSCSLAAE